MGAKKGDGAEADEAAAATPATTELRAWPLLTFLGLAGICLLVYGAALRGPFVSDDFGYLVSHPYTETLDVETVVAVFDPFGPAKFHAANYAPVHLVLTALERQIFAEETLGYHLVNVIVHAVNATLLAVLFVGSGIPRTGALLGALLFALHPANVEAVAWITQLKTNGALLFSLAALIAFRRHPGWATLPFVLGLLTKASAAFALPTAAAFHWAWAAAEPGEGRRRWAWLAVWLLLFAAYAVPQMASFSHIGGVTVEAYDDVGVHLRSVAAVGARYLVMAASSWGVSAFQEPDPATSWLDPWWLLALPAGALLGGRLFVTLRDRRVEAAWWVFAAASFAPVSQVFPFLNPVADRYLYFILPGLLGGVLCAWTEWSRGRSASPRRAAAALALGLAVFFGVHATSRAELWRGETWLFLDAARHYPEGSIASLMRARRAARDGDVRTAVAELRGPTEEDLDNFIALLQDPGLVTIRSDPLFRELVHDVAGRYIERARRRGVETQSELRMLALAHIERGELAEAEASYARALEIGGPLDENLRNELGAVRRARRGNGEGGHPAPRP